MKQIPTTFSAIATLAILRGCAWLHPDPTADTQKSTDSPILLLPGDPIPSYEPDVGTTPNFASCTGCRS